MAVGRVACRYDPYSRSRDASSWDGVDELYERYRQGDVCMHLDLPLFGHPVRVHVVDTGLNRVVGFIESDMTGVLLAHPGRFSITRYNDSVAFAKIVTRYAQSLPGYDAGHGARDGDPVPGEPESAGE